MAQPKEIQFLDFEAPIEDVIRRLRDMESLEGSDDKTLPVKDLEDEINSLHLKEKTITRRIYRNLTPWQKVKVARHPQRPHATQYIEELIDDYLSLAGDRLFGEDGAMLGGVGRFMGQSVAVLGIEKGVDTHSRVKANFGMPKPEGYRKAKRIMDLAQRFNLPLITFVDTPGAFPGIEAEARGQSEAIASCIAKLLDIDVPVISVITGEGGSGGALAIAVADKVMMLEHSVYSVISPEGCASILWRDSSYAEQAADALKLTQENLFKLGVVDEVIKEPVGGAHRDYELVMKRVKSAIAKGLKEIHTAGSNRKNRREKFIKMTKTVKKKTEISVEE